MDGWMDAGAAEKLAGAIAIAIAIAIANKSKYEKGSSGRAARGESDDDDVQVKPDDDVLVAMLHQHSNAHWAQVLMWKGAPCSRLNGVWASLKHRP